MKKSWKLTSASFEWQSQVGVLFSLLTDKTHHSGQGFACAVATGNLRHIKNGHLQGCSQSLAAKLRYVFVASHHDQMRMLLVARAGTFKLGITQTLTPLGSRLQAAAYGWMCTVQSLLAVYHPQ
jgi:hypothetical protein